MWGTLPKFANRRQNPRFIPTHVGNTAYSRASTRLMTVHPHACGEHGHRVYIIPRALGSSPRMWGTLKDFCEGWFQSRFIPTHVGNTPPPGRRCPGGAVHPHACGEHQALADGTTLADSSSPRMWGTRPQLPADGLRHRFIPTHVGNTTIPDNLTAAAIGSSPRMWGTRCRDLNDRGDHRFIPTHVGNTRSRGVRPRSGTVHPHACGEHGLFVLRDDLPAGSSPRMWGTLDRPIVDGVKDGSSPRMWGTRQL